MEAFARNRNVVLSGLDGSNQRICPAAKIDDDLDGPVDGKAGVITVSAFPQSFAVRDHFCSAGGEEADEREGNGHLNLRSVVQRVTVPAAFADIILTQ